MHPSSTMWSQQTSYMLLRAVNFRFVMSIQEMCQFESYLCKSLTVTCCVDLSTDFCNGNSQRKSILSLWADCTSTVCVTMKADNHCWIMNMKHVLSSPFFFRFIKGYVTKSPKLITLNWTSVCYYWPCFYCFYLILVQQKSLHTTVCLNGSF